MYVMPKDDQYCRNMKLVLTELMKFVVVYGDGYINFKYNTPQRDEPYQQKSFNVNDDIKIIPLCMLTSTSYTITLGNKILAHERFIVFVT